MSKSRLLIIVSLVFVSLSLAVGLYAAATNKDTKLAMSEMSVKKLTCGACVSNITTALADVPGVETVEVSVTTGRSQVMFDSTVVDAETIAKTINDIGYPTTILRQLSSEQYQVLLNEEAALADIYVAKIGDRLIGRDEFEALVQQKIKASQATDRPELRPQMVNQAWQGLKQRTLLLSDADKNQVVVQNGEVELKIESIKNQTPNYTHYVSTAFASEDDFFRQTKEDMIINKNIQANVLAAITSPEDRQVRFNQWFQNLLNNSSVTIYDENLKQIASGGGSSCGSGSGGCCG